MLLQLQYPARPFLHNERHAAQEAKTYTDVVPHAIVELKLASSYSG